MNTTLQDHCPPVGLLTKEDFANGVRQNFLTEIDLSFVYRYTRSSGNLVDRFLMISRPKKSVCLNIN